MATNKIRVRRRTENWNAFLNVGRLIKLQLQWHFTPLKSNQIKSNYLFHCLLKSRRNFFAFTFVIKNKVALVKQLPKANTTEIPAINSSTDFPLLYSWCLIILRIMLRIIVSGAKKKHNSNIILILSFVTFLLIISELATVDILCTFLDVRIVFTWGIITIPTIKTSITT